MLRYLFIYGHMLKEISRTYITPILKIDHPDNVYPQRPIILFNLLYKIKSKIFANRLTKVIPRITIPFQGALIQGRDIDYNILVAHEFLISFFF